MKNKLAVVAVVLALLAFGYVFTLNPGPVEFQIYPGTRVTTSVALVLFLFFLAGFGTAMLLSAFREAMRSLGFWRHRKADERRAEARALLLAGRAEAALGRTRKARRFLRRAWRKARDEALVALEMARVELAEGRTDQAERILRDLLAHDPGSAEALVLMVEVYRRRGDYEGQIAALRRWLEKDPDHPEALARLRDLYRDRANWGEAVRVQERLAAKARDRAEKERARKELVELRFRRATSGPAGPDKEQLQELVRSEREFAPAYQALGEALQAGGNPDAAVETWLRGYQATGQAGLLLRALEERKAQGRAKDLIKPLKKLSRKGASAPLFLARLLLDLEENEEALALLDRLPAPVAGTRIARALRAEALYRARSFDLAAREFRAAVTGEGPAAPGFAFACSACGRRTGVWNAACPGCSALDTLVLDLEAFPPRTETALAAAGSVP
ncbi:tetratricopeptide repeat protein [Deferrisoma camini]|uniref:tetratricopeptide repeat protein n=1 Tax=Deferrisoma camini TaxID=1035120 RepID=UPI00046D5C9C|nr:tetratricopeptide repeat protein [Deferrisoma camini]